MAFVITDGPLKTGQISAESTCFHSGQRVHMILSLSAQQMLRRWKKAENYRSDPCKITTSHYTWLGFRKHPLVRPQQRPGKVDRAGIISILTGGEMIDFKVKWLACTRSQVRQWRSRPSRREAQPSDKQASEISTRFPSFLVFQDERKQRVMAKRSNGFWHWQACTAIPALPPISCLALWGFLNLPLHLSFLTCKMGIKPCYLLLLQWWVMIWWTYNIQFIHSTNICAWHTECRSYNSDQEAQSCSHGVKIQFK